MAFCGAPAWIVTCASTRFCAAGDFGGASVYSTAPAGGIGAWQNGPFSDSYVGLSCTSASFCLAGCAPGYGSGDGCDSSDANDYGAAVVFSWGLDRHGLPVTGTGFTEISPGQLNGIWCQDAHQCFASAYDGLYDATNPTGDPSAWHQVVRTRTGYSGAREITDVACPSTTRCIAIDSSGYWYLGSPPASNAAISTTLTTLRPRGTDAGERYLLTHSGYVVTFDSPSTGTVRVSWTTGNGRSRRVLAIGTARFPAAGPEPIAIKLTPVGVDELAGNLQLSLTIRATFTESDRISVTNSGSDMLHP